MEMGKNVEQQTGMAVGRVGMVGIGKPLMPEVFWCDGSVASHMNMRRPLIQWFWGSANGTGSGFVLFQHAKEHGYGVGEEYGFGNGNGRGRGDDFYER